MQDSDFLLISCEDVEELNSGVARPLHLYTYIVQVVTQINLKNRYKKNVRIQKAINTSYISYSFSMCEVGWIPSGGS